MPDAPIIDTIEQYFLVHGPDHGLFLDCRKTGVDIVASAYADDLVNIEHLRFEEAAKNPSLTEKQREESILMAACLKTEDQIFVHDPRGFIPIIERKGVVIYCFMHYSETCSFDFMIVEDYGKHEKLDSLEQVDEIIKKRDYNVDFALYYGTEPQSDYFLVGVEKKFDGTTETNKVRGLYPGAPENPSPALRRLYASLMEFASKYPEGSVVDPSGLAMDFLNALGKGSPEIENLAEDFLGE